MVHWQVWKVIANEWCSKLLELDKIFEETRDYWHLMISIGSVMRRGTAYGRGSGISTEVSSRIEEPLFGMLVGVPSFGASKYDGGPPLYRGGAFEVGVDGLSITKQLTFARGREAKVSKMTL